MKKNKYTIPEQEYYSLTDKQYKFAQLYIQTGNVIESYKESYNTNASANSISSQAYKVLNNEKVQRYIEDVTKKAYEQAIRENREIMSTVDVLEWLTSVIKSNSRSIKMADRLKAADMILKTNGAYVQKIEADVNSTNDIVINISNENQDEEE